MDLFQIMYVCDSKPDLLEVIIFIILFASFIPFIKGIWDICDAFIHNKKNKKSKLKRGIILVCVSLLVMLVILLNFNSLFKSCYFK